MSMICSSVGFSTALISSLRSVGVLTVMNLGVARCSLG